jgi:cyclopropane fatty-acyl-phospholipid synthase-like methyltransferase
MPYPQSLPDLLDLDGGERLLDVGCGPGSLTNLLAPHVAEAVGIDASAEMVDVAARGAPPNALFLRLRAEELPGSLGRFDIVTLAQSFHWFETEAVARTLHAMLAPGGRLAHVGATTHEGEGNAPRDEIAALIERWLGPDPRIKTGDHRVIFDRVGFRNRRELDVARDETIERSEDDIVSSVFSLSYAAPHLFGERVGDFQSELRALLRGGGPYYERPRFITLTVWDR